MAQLDQKGQNNQDRNVGNAGRDQTKTGTQGDFGRKTGTDHNLGGDQMRSPKKSGSNDTSIDRDSE